MKRFTINIHADIYYFTDWTGDAPSSSLMNRVIVNSNLNIADHFNTWKPPVGIPSPEFGIFEKHTMYTGKTFDFEFCIKMKKGRTKLFA